MLAAIIMVLINFIGLLPFGALRIEVALFKNLL